MKKITFICAMVIGMFCISGVQAGDAVTLTGKGVCAKCNLKSADKCATVLQVKDGDTTKNYYVKGKMGKKIKGKEGSVTGTVKEVDGKLMLAATGVEIK